MSLRSPASPAWGGDPERSPALRIVDVAMFYGERSGGIRTYLEAKAAYAARTGRFEHHLVDPRPRRPRARRRAAATSTARCGWPPPTATGCRSGGAGLQTTLHDAGARRRPAPRSVLDPAAGQPRRPRARRRGDRRPSLLGRAARRRAARAPRRLHARAAALVSPRLPRGRRGHVGRRHRSIDTRRPSTLRLRLGLEPAFRPRPRSPRGDHVLYVGRLSRRRACASCSRRPRRQREPWPLVLLGTGPDGRRAARARSAARTRRRGSTFEPYVRDRDELARRYAARTLRRPPRRARDVRAGGAGGGRLRHPGRHRRRDAVGRADRRAASTPSGPATAATCCARSSAPGGGTPDPRRGAALAARHGWDARPRRRARRPRAPGPGAAT